MAAADIGDGNAVRGGVLSSANVDAYLIKITFGVVTSTICRRDAVGV